VEARNQLVRKHLRWVRQVALQIQQRLPVHVELEELVQAGTMGLLEAATNFDPQRGVQFITYAKYRVRGAILDALRDLDCATRYQRQRQKEVTRAADSLTAAFDRKPTTAEIAAELGISEQHLWRIGMCPANGLVVSASHITLDNDVTFPRDLPDLTHERLDEVFARRELRRHLLAAMGSLPERHRRVLILHYLEELTLKEIGARLGVNESRVSQIHRAALEKLAVAFKMKGVSSSSVLFTERCPGTAQLYAA